MTRQTINVTEALQIESCPTCFVRYAVPVEVLNRRYQDGGAWYCPNGHRVVYTESEVHKLQRQLSDAQERANSSAELERIARGELRTTSKELRNLKRRVNAGICPHCHRTFQQLQRHIHSKHPEA